MSLITHHKCTCSCGHNTGEEARSPAAQVTCMPLLLTCILVANTPLAKASQMADSRHRGGRQPGCMLATEARSPAAQVTCMPLLLTCILVANTPLAKASQMADSRHRGGRHDKVTWQSSGDGGLGPVMQSVPHKGYDNL